MELGREDPRRGHEWKIETRAENYHVIGVKADRFARAGPPALASSEHSSFHYPLVYE